MNLLTCVLARQSYRLQLPQLWQAAQAAAGGGVCPPLQHAGSCGGVVGVPRHAARVKRVHLWEGEGSQVGGCPVRRCCRHSSSAQSVGAPLPLVQCFKPACPLTRPGWKRRTASATCSATAAAAHRWCMPSCGQRHAGAAIGRVSGVHRTVCKLRGRRDVHHHTCPCPCPTCRRGSSTSITSSRSIYICRGDGEHDDSGTSLQRGHDHACTCMPQQSVLMPRCLPPQLDRPQLLLIPLQALLTPSHMQACSSSRDRSWPSPSALPARLMVARRWVGLRLGCLTYLFHSASLPMARGKATDRHTEHSRHTAVHTARPRTGRQAQQRHARLLDGCEVQNQG